MEFLDEKLFEKDLKSIAMWLNVESIAAVDVQLTKMKLSEFRKQIDEMEATYEEFPKDKKRSQRIYNKIKEGAPPQPIFIEKEDPTLFVMEGRHRMVAFKWLGFEEIIVAKVSKKDLKLEFKHKNIKKLK